MSYTVNDKLPETFFMETLIKNGRNVKETLKGHQQQFSDMHKHWAKYGHIKIFKPQEEDSLKLHYTFSNLRDLKEQLYQLWVQLNYVLKEN